MCKRRSFYFCDLTRHRNRGWDFRDHLDQTLLSISDHYIVHPS